MARSARHRNRTGVRWTPLGDQRRGPSGPLFRSVGPVGKGPVKSGVDSCGEREYLSDTSSHKESLYGLTTDIAPLLTLVWAHAYTGCLPCPNSLGPCALSRG